MDNKVLKSALLEFYEEDKDVTSFMENRSIDSILDLAKTRMKTLAEFRNLVINKNPELSSDEKNIAKVLFEKFSLIENWNKEKILVGMKEVLQKNKIKGSVLYKIITGFETGLPLPESMTLLGKEKTLERIKSAINL